MSKLTWILVLLAVLGFAAVSAYLWFADPGVSVGLSPQPSAGPEMARSEMAQLRGSESLEMRAPVASQATSSDAKESAPSKGDDKHLSLTFYGGREVIPGLATDAVGSRSLSRKEFESLALQLVVWQQALSDLAAKRYPRAFLDPLDEEQAIEAVGNGLLLLPQPSRGRFEQGKYHCPPELAGQLGELRMLHLIALKSSSYAEEVGKEVIGRAQERRPDALLQIVPDETFIGQYWVEDLDGKRFASFFSNVPGQ